MNQDKMTITFLALSVVFFVFAVIYAKKKQNKNTQAYLEKYPNAVKVYLSCKKENKLMSQILCIKVDDQKPATFKDENGKGFYVKAEESVVKLQKFEQKVKITGKVKQIYGDIIAVNFKFEQGKDYQAKAVDSNFEIVEFNNAINF